MLLGIFGAPRKWVAVYAFNPLVLIDLCANMHYDVFVIAALLAAMIALSKKSVIAAFALLGIAALMKYFALLLLPLFVGAVFRNGPAKDWKKSALGIVVFIAVIVCGYALFLDKGIDFVKGILFFANELHVTAYSPYYFIARAVGKSAANATAAILLCGLSAYAFFKMKNSSLHTLMFLMLAAVALFSPVQRPWYFAWALPLCCFKLSWSWLLLTCASLLTYGIYVSGTDICPLKMIIYSLFYISVIVEVALFIRNRINTTRANNV